MFISVRMWDIRPFAPLERCLKVFTGAQHNFEKVLSVAVLTFNRNNEKLCLNDQVSRMNNH